MSKLRTAMIQLNIAVVLFGLAGLLGKATTASPMMIVLGRTAFGTLAFAVLFLCGLLKWPTGSPRQLLKLTLPGAILAFHWVCFFQSIQLSSVAVALLAYSSFPIFITIFEPVFFHEPRRAVDLLTAILVLAGVAVMVPAFDLSDRTTAGIVWGVLSGLSFAALLLLNRKLAIEFSPAVTAAGQAMFAALVLLMLLPSYYQPLEVRDWLVLILLGVVFTALAHFLFIQSLVHVRAQLASIVSSLESVYGVLFAGLLLGEWPTWRTVAGGSMILCAVLIGALCQPVSAKQIAETPQA